AEDGIRDFHVTGVQTCALPIYLDHFPCRPHGLNPLHFRQVFGFGKGKEIHNVIYDEVPYRPHNRSIEKPGPPRRQMVVELTNTRSEERRVGREERMCGVVTA